MRCCCSGNRVVQDDSLQAHLNDLDIILKNLFSPSRFDLFRDLFKSREYIESERDALRRACVDNLLQFHQVIIRESLYNEEVNKRIRACFRLHLKLDMKHKIELNTLLESLDERQEGKAFVVNILRTILGEIFPET